MQTSSRLDTAVVMAGGLGTRLGSITAAVPKPLVCVKGRPFLEYQLKLLKRHLVSKVILLTGYLGDQIEEYLGSGKSLGLSLVYSRESEPLGTGGALSLAADILPGVFFLVYGDSYVDLDYQAVYSAYQAFAGSPAISRNLSGPCGLMVVSPVYEHAVGNVALNETGNMVASYKKNAGGAYNLVDAGVLVLSREITALLPAALPSSLEECIYPALARQGRLAAFKSDARYYDIGTPERLATFERTLT